MMAKISAKTNDIAAPIMPYFGIRKIFKMTLKDALAMTCFNTSFSCPAAISPVE